MTTITIILCFWPVFSVFQMINTFISFGRNLHGDHTWSVWDHSDHLCGECWWYKNGCYAGERREDIKVSITHYYWVVTDRKGKVMFSQACVSHSIHNRPHGYSFSARPCYIGLVCIPLECFLVIIFYLRERVGILFTYIHKKFRYVSCEKPESWERTPEQQCCDNFIFVTIFLRKKLIHFRKTVSISGV